MTPPALAPREPEYLVIARLLAPFGVAGEIKAEVITDFPERFALLEQVYLGEKHTPYALESARLIRQGVLLKFVGLDSPEAIQPLVGEYVYIPLEQAMPLEPNEYYEHQILGLKVWTEEGELLGRVSEVLFTGSNDVYVVTPPKGGEDLLLPAIQDVVREINLEQGRMVVRLLEGLR